MTRAKAAERLKAIRKRLKATYGAERHRRERTLFWKREYEKALKAHGEKDDRTQRALVQFRQSRRLGWRIDKTQRLLRKRARQKIQWLKKHPPPLDPDGDGLITIDGKQVAAEVGKELLRIRAAGRWHGYVVSGYRTPAYSQQLCYRICGRPSCPGLCAGTSSNHTRKGGRNGAADLTDYLTFAYECRRLGSWLENHLPRDLVHFSDSGN